MRKLLSSLDSIHGRFPKSWRCRSRDVFQEQVRFGNELHVGVFDAVVNHLDVVACAVLADVGAARLAVGSLGGDGFVDRLDFRIRVLVAAGHDGRAAAGAVFAAGNAHAVEVDARFAAAVIAAARVAEVRVAAVDDDVACIEDRNKLFNHAVYRRAGHDHEHDLARLFQGADKFLQVVVAFDVVVRPFRYKFFRQIRRVVVYRYGKAWSAIFRAKLLPMTAMPTTPISRNSIIIYLLSASLYFLLIFRNIGKFSL